MIYAQTSYPQRLGKGPFTISEAGCFLVSDTNLLSDRFGININPLQLNDYFNQHGNYCDIDGDNTMDDLAWSTISAYDGRITCQVGGPGWPDTNNAIVKFVYKSKRTGQTTTHFCLVADHTQGTIIDSWDGVTKKSPYGTPVAWAKYELHAPQVVTPPPAPTHPAFTIENIPEVTKELVRDTKLWDMNRRSWPDMVNNPVGGAGIGTKFQTNQIARHILGGSYYLPMGSSSQGFNVVDCKEPTAVASAPTPQPEPAPAPAPAPQAYTVNTVDGIEYRALDGAPKKMYVAKQGGCEIWSFGGVQTWRDFKSVKHLEYGAEVFVVGSALHPIPPKGAMYLMQDSDFGDFRKTGTVVNQVGIAQVDLSDTPPPPIPVAAPVEVVTPVPVETKVETEPVSSTVPVRWKDTYQPFAKPVHCMAVKNLTVKDYNDDNPAPEMPLPKYVPGVSEVKVWAFGTFMKDGVNYYRLRANNDPNFRCWYAVPKLDPETHTPLLLVTPDKPLMPVSKVQVARDALELAKARLEQDMPKFLDDIMPKWLRNKK